MVVVRLICNLVSVWVDGLDQVYLLLGGVGKKGFGHRLLHLLPVASGCCCGSRLASFFCFLLSLSSACLACMLVGRVVGCGGNVKESREMFGETDRRIFLCILFDSKIFFTTPSPITPKSTTTILTMALNQPVWAASASMDEDLVKNHPIRPIVTELQPPTSDCQHPVDDCSFGLC
jgi:hypothetical protein